MLIIGETKYKEPSNCEDKKKAIKMIYGNATWFAGNYLVLENKICKVVGKARLKIAVSGILGVIPVDDMLIFDIAGGFVVVNDEFNWVFSRMSTGFRDAGKIYGNTYIITDENELIVLNSVGDNVILPSATMIKNFEPCENGHRAKIKYAMPDLYRGFNLSDYITIYKDGTVKYM